MQSVSPPPLRGYGEPAPMFVAPVDELPILNLSSMGGRWIVLAFLGSLAFPASAEGLRVALERRAAFDGEESVLFTVSADPADRDARGLRGEPPGLRCFWDFDRAISRVYGVAEGDGYAPTAFLIDPTLRIMASEPVDRIDRLIDLMARMRTADAPERAEMIAPVLTLPHVFEPEFCQELVDYYHRKGGERSGVMREAGGMTVGVLDDNFKRRRDVYLDGDPLLDEAMNRLAKRLVPMVARVFGWQATRIERYLIACYDSADRGMFRAHRDNTTSATAHRKFAVTLNLNDGYDGGELRFPEFGTRTYKPGVGGAVVFGCSLLHEATPVERGVRFAFVPFLYDEAGAKMREAGVKRLSLDAAQAQAAAESAASRT